MPYYSLKFGLNGEVGQPQITAKLQSANLNFIQTASGLCVHSPEGQRALVGALGELGNGVTVEGVARESEHPADIQAFMDAST